MSENILAKSADNPSFRELLRAPRTIAFGGLAVGVLDGLAASINGSIKGISPVIVWQYVASGLLGRDSYNHGWKTAFLGLLIHFFIAFSVTAIYYAASRRFPILIRRTVMCGILYAIIVYFVMGYIITPLSAAPKLPFSFSSLLTGLLIHILCVGLPIALIVRRFAKSG